MPRPNAAQQREKAIRAAYAAVFGSPEGKLVLHDLIARGGLLRTSMVAGDSHETAFQEGRRALMLEVLGVMRWNEGRVAALVGERVHEPEGATAPDPEYGEFA